MWLLSFPVLALALLGAHFWRSQSWPAVLLCIALLVLLAWPRRWVARLAQAALLLGAADWAWTAFVLAQQRLAQGQPYARLVLILAAVALFTAGAAAVFASPRLRRHYAAPG